MGGPGTAGQGNAGGYANCLLTSVFAADIATGTTCILGQTILEEEVAGVQAPPGAMGLTPGATLAMEALGSSTPLPGLLSTTAGAGAAEGATAGRSGCAVGTRLS